MPLWLWLVLMAVGLAFVAFRRYGEHAALKVSPLVKIRLAPGGDGRVVVDARIEKYRTVQSTFMMIPIGPKTLVGRGTYFSLLKSLEQELRAVDRGQGSVRRTSAAG